MNTSSKRTLYTFDCRTKFHARSRVPCPWIGMLTVIPLRCSLLTTSPYPLSLCSLALLVRHSVLRRAGHLVSEEDVEGSERLSERMRVRAYVHVYVLYDPSLSYPHLPYTTLHDPTLLLPRMKSLWSVMLGDLGE